MLQCDSLTVRYDRIAALDAVSIRAAVGTTTAIMGESGSGKSTLLRAVAGLVDPESGTVSWNGNDVTSQLPHLRRFGFMFQDYALFPHMSVGGNIGFGLRMQGRTAREEKAAVGAMLELVGLAGHEDRSVSELSGGEQQRVALARTLAPAPELILLDEPLGALDRARRDQLLGDMQRIFTELGVTALYVTHDHREAFSIANEVVVLDAGRKVAQAKPALLWRAPGRVAVATLLGFPVIRDVTVEAGLAHIGGILVGVDLPNGRYHLAIPPKALSMSPTGATPTVVLATRFEDGADMAVIELAGIEMTAATSGATELGPAAVDIDGTALLVVED